MNHQIKNNNLVIKSVKSKLRKLTHVKFQYSCGSSYIMSKNEFKKIFNETIFPGKYSPFHLRCYIEDYITELIYGEEVECDVSIIINVVFYFSDLTHDNLTKSEFFSTFIESDDYKNRAEDFPIRWKQPYYHITPVLAVRQGPNKFMFFTEEGLKFK